MKKLLLLLLLFISFSGLADTYYDELFVQENAFQNAVNAYKEGDCEKAFNIWSNRAKSGIFDWFDADADSQYELGNYYLDGICVNKDYKKALAWFKKAAKQDNSKAQLKYGLMHYWGYGVEQDSEKAFSWIMKSANQGNIAAAAWIKNAIKEPQAKEAELRVQESITPTSIPKLDYGYYHALVIGNDQYREHKPLSNAVNDANAVASLLRSKYQFKVDVLTNATRVEILSALSTLRKTISDKDNLLIYYAGHGVLDKDMDEGFWLPVDAGREDDVNWIPNDDIIRSVRVMKAKHVMVVADSCFSGTLIRGIKIREESSDYLKEIVKKKARTVLTSGGLEPVSDVGGGNNSVFAAAFMRILNENTGVMDGNQLFTTLRRQVMINADQTPEYGDIRKAGHDGGDFLFVRQ